MRPIDRDQITKQLQWRYATKQFDPNRKISPADWAALEDTLLLSPSSFGLQPWKFIIVKNPAIREKLVPVSWGQRQIAEASHLVVFAVKKELGQQDIEDYLERIADVRGVPLESLGSFREMLVDKVLKGMNAAARRAWATRQVYIALGNLLSIAALLEIDTCPIEGMEPLRYDEILGLDADGLGTVVAAAAGYRAEGDNYATLKKVRFAKEQVVVEV